MTDRERLIELLNQVRGNEIALADYEADILVDHLLANGVVVPPIKKVGEKLYFHQFNNKLEKVVVDGEIIKIANGEREYVVKLKDGRNLTFLISFFGKTVFLTKEEAEQALKERDCK